MFPKLHELRQSPKWTTTQMFSKNAAKCNKLTQSQIAKLHSKCSQNTDMVQNVRTCYNTEYYVGPIFTNFRNVSKISPEMFPKPGLPDKRICPALWTSQMLFYLIWSTQDKQEREVLWPLKLYGYLPIINHKRILFVCFFCLSV